MKKPAKGPLSLLLITPALIVLQFFIGYGIIQRIVDLNALEDKHNRLELYLRNQLMFLINAETGQRGYLLTSNKDYLEPYNEGLDNLQRNDTLLSGLVNLVDTEQFEKLQELTRKKLNIMQSTLALHDQGLQDSAMILLKTNRGKLTMDSIRDNIEEYLTVVSVNLKDAQKRLNDMILIFVGIMLSMFLFQIAFAFYGYSRFLQFSNGILTLLGELEEKNKSLREFTFMSYHQLKEPLRSISGFTQLLRKKNEALLDDESKEFINHTINAVDQMNETIKNLRQEHLKNQDHTLP